jgi:PAS domain S-box-containing protein
MYKIIHEQQLMLLDETDKYETEYRIQTIYGDYIWFYDIGSIVKRDSNGDPLKIIGLVNDITERKNAELFLKINDGGTNCVDYREGVTF